VRGYVTMGIVPAGTRGNLKYISQFVDFAPDVPEPDRLILADAITSGGLLISVPADKSKDLVATLREKGVVNASVIGTVDGTGEGRITVLKES